MNIDKNNKIHIAGSSSNIRHIILDMIYHLVTNKQYGTILNKINNNNNITGNIKDIGNIIISDKETHILYLYINITLSDLEKALNNINSKKSDDYLKKISEKVKKISNKLKQLNIKLPTNIIKFDVYNTEPLKTKQPNNTYVGSIDIDINNPKNSLNNLLQLLKNTQNKYQHKEYMLIPSGNSWVPRVIRGLQTIEKQTHLRKISDQRNKKTNEKTYYYTIVELDKLQLPHYIQLEIIKELCKKYLRESNKPIEIKPEDIKYIGELKNIINANNLGELHITYYKNNKPINLRFMPNRKYIIRNQSDNDVQN